MMSHCCCNCRYPTVEPEETIYEEWTWACRLCGFQASAQSSSTFTISLSMIESNILFQAHRWIGTAARGAGATGCHKSDMSHSETGNYFWPYHLYYNSVLMAKPVTIIAEADTSLPNETQSVGD